MFEQLFGVHERALILASDRVGVLAANIANVDTPNYKARDFDYSALLQGSSTDASLTLTRTHVGHIAIAPEALSASDLKYRNPYQPSLDGNTVEAPVEQAKFAENALRFQTSLDLLNRQIAAMQLAIVGQ